jgi:hypothetical protein
VEVNVEMVEWSKSKGIQTSRLDNNRVVYSLEQRFQSATSIVVF